MTHPPTKVEEALRLRSDGLIARSIGERLGIPRSTVSGWINGRTPQTPEMGHGHCEACGGASHDYKELPIPYPYLLGLYLGDGCISAHPRSVYKLRLSLDSAYPRIIEEAASAMRKVLPASKVNRWHAPRHCVEVYSYSKAWPCLFPQHGPGKKHLRPIELTDWQSEMVGKNPQLLLRGLIQSDGCRFINTGRAWRHPRYSFRNLSSDIRLIFTNACDEVGLRWTDSGTTVYVSRKADVARMDEFIGPKT